MVIYALHRLAILVPQVFLVAIGAFILLRLLPADPVAGLVGLNATPESYAIAERELGLDRSIGAQLGSYLQGLIQGDFGKSWTTGVSVRDEIVDRFPVTIQLIVLAFVLALAIGIPLGRLLASRPGGPADKGVLGYSLFAGSQPDFWWGLMFIYVFFFLLGVFPAPLGMTSPGTDVSEPITNFILLDSLLRGNFTAFVDVLKHLALPVLTITFILTGPIIKMTRESVLAAVNSDYMLYSKAAGLSARLVRSYMTRNSLAPVITLTGILFGFMLSGAVITETVFSLDGLGVYALQRTLAVDFPSVQGAIVIMTVFSLLIYLMMDLVYAVLDPRVRYGR